MARWASVCILGDADFSLCRVELVDAGGFYSPRVGSVDFANDGTPIVQTVLRDRRGILFSLKMVSAEGTALQALFTSIAAAEATNQSIRGRITDGIIAVDIFTTPNYSIDPWWTFDKHSEGWYENVVTHWVSKGDYTV